MSSDVIPRPVDPAPTRPRPALSRPALAALAASWAGRRSEWEALLQFPETGRWWHRLAATDRADVWLLTWSGDQATGLHDHGDSRAEFAVVAGELVELRASRSGSLSRVVLSAGTSRTVPVRAVHHVSNGTAPRSVSVHAYSPPLRRMTHYERVGGRLTVVGVDLLDGRVPA